MDDRGVNMVDKIKIKCDVMGDDMPFYLCRSRDGHRMVWSSYGMPLELSVEDAFRLAELQKFVVVEFVAHCLHVVSRASFDELNKKEPIVGFVVVKIGGGGNALNKPDGAVGSGESLSFGGDAHGVAPVKSATVADVVLIKRRKLLDDLQVRASSLGSFNAPDPIYAEARRTIIAQQAEIQDLRAVGEMLGYIKKYVLKSIEAQAAAA